MIITIIKTAQVDVGDLFGDEAMMEVDVMDSEDGIVFDVEYYDEAGNQLN